MWFFYIKRANCLNGSWFKYQQDGWIVCPENAGWGVPELQNKTTSSKTATINSHGRATLGSCNLKGVQTSSHSGCQKLETDGEDSRERIGGTIYIDMFERKRWDIAKDRGTMMGFRSIPFAAEGHNRLKTIIIMRFLIIPTRSFFKY